MKKLVFLGVLCSMSPVTASGAELFFTSAGTKFVDGTRIIPLYIHLDTNECVNAAEVHLNIKGEGARILGFKHNDALFPMWLGEKTVDNSSLIVGATDEICGSLGESNGVVASVVVVAQNGGVINFTEDTNIAIADGQGSVAKLKAGAFVIPVEKKAKRRYL